MSWKDCIALTDIQQRLYICALAEWKQASLLTLPAPSRPSVEFVGDGICGRHLTRTRSVFPGVCCADLLIVFK